MPPVERARSKPPIAQANRPWVWGRAIRRSTWKKRRSWTWPSSISSRPRRSITEPFAPRNTYLIQYFVNSLGRDAASSADLMSYLLFTSKYTKDLIEIGYGDADQRIDEIERFDPVESVAPP